MKPDNKPTRDLKGGRVCPTLFCRAGTDGGVRGLEGNCVQDMCGAAFCGLLSRMDAGVGRFFLSC